MALAYHGTEAKSNVAGAVGREGAISSIVFTLCSVLARRALSETCYVDTVHCSKGRRPMHEPISFASEKGGDKRRRFSRGDADVDETCDETRKDIWKLKVDFQGIYERTFLRRTVDFIAYLTKWIAFQSADSRSLPENSK